jgi:hypothetical protein
MAVKALIAAALLVAITVGVLIPVPHGASQAEARSTIPSLQLTRG